MILEEIRRDTIHGQKMKEPFMKKAMIDSFLIDKLIEERIQKKDCKMQGFVLEGYPKDQAQFENLKSMRINPTLIVALDCPIEVSAKRLPQSDANFSDRFQKWNSFSQFLHSSNEPILFVKQDKKP